MPEFNQIDEMISRESVYMTMFTILMTVLLSSLLVFTYDKSTPLLGRAQNFIQSLMLMSVITATIMQSIGDSLALSFGIFGALTIIRFRSNISDPRDIAFIFATMAIGIACGVHSFINALLGTIAFCLIIFFLRLTPFSISKQIKGSVRLDTGNNQNILHEAEKVIQDHSVTHRLTRYRVTQAADGVESTEYEYAFIVRNIQEAKQLHYTLHSIDNVKIQRLVFEDNFNSQETT